MNKAYRRLMAQQCLSDQTKQDIYCNLQMLEPNKPRSVRLKAAIVAACIMLMIPISVLAAEHIFGIAIFNRVEHATIHDQPGIGYKIRFNTIKNRPITDFSEHLQRLEETTVVCYDSWDDAEKDLGVDLISNSIFTDTETKQILSYVAEGTPQTSHCEGVYCVADGQLFYSKISAVYQRSRVKFTVSAHLTAKHPTIAAEELQKLHGSEYIYFQEDNPGFKADQYTTKNGIPMTVSIVNGIVNGVDYTDYSVYFAVNDISYNVSIVDCEGVWNDSHIYAVLCEVLESFYF